MTILRKIAGAPLLAPADSGGGGAGGGGQGGQDGQDGGGGDDGADDIDQRIDRRVNAAISNQLSRFRNSFERDVNRSITAALEPITSQLQQFQRPEPDPAEGGAGGGGRDTAPPAVDPRVEAERKKQEARIQELEKKYEQERQQREEEAAARAREEERNALAQVLHAQGIDGARARAAVSLLYNEERRVQRSEDGSIVFTVPKAGYTDYLTLDEGVTEWLKTEDGKAFLPPRPAAGGGGRTSHAPNPRNQRLSPQERKHQAKMRLAQLMGVIPSEE